MQLSQFHKWETKQRGLPKAQGRGWDQYSSLLLAPSLSSQKLPQLHVHEVYDSVMKRNLQRIQLSQAGCFKASPSLQTKLILPLTYVSMTSGEITGF